MYNENPFTPNFGEAPMHMAGRTAEINDFMYVLERGISSPSRTSLYKGARGTGKTVLMSFLGTEAEQRGWICVNVSATKDMREDILQQAFTKLNAIFPQSEKKQLSGISFAQLLGMEWKTEAPYKPTWRTRMTMVLDAMQEQNLGLLVTIDEVDPNFEDVILFAADYQIFIRENRKIALLMAGLPEKVSLLLDAEGSTFLRRAAQYTLGTVENADIEVALIKTVTESGKRIGTDTLKYAVSEINGQPYMMQLVGFRAWQLAGDNEELSLDNMKNAVRLAREDYENRVLSSILKKLSDTDILFLKSMLQDDSESKIFDIKNRMHKSDSYVARYKKRLIEAGAIEQAGRGRVAFVSNELKRYIENQK